MICNATYLVDTLYVRGLTNQPYQLMEQGPKHDFLYKGGSCLFDCGFVFVEEEKFVFLLS